MILIHVGSCLTSVGVSYQPFCLDICFVDFCCHENIIMFSWQHKSTKPCLLMVPWLFTSIHHQHTSTVQHKKLVKQFGNMAISRQGDTFRITSLCKGNPPVTGVFPSQRENMRRFDVFSLAWKNYWTYSWVAGDLKCYDVTVMKYHQFMS